MRIAYAEERNLNEDSKYSQGLLEGNDPLMNIAGPLPFVLGTVVEQTSHYFLPPKPAKPIMDSKPSTRPSLA